MADSGVVPRTGEVPPELRGLGKYTRFVLHAVVRETAAPADVVCVLRVHLSALGVRTRFDTEKLGFTTSRPLTYGAGMSAAINPCVKLGVGSRGRAVVCATRNPEAPSSNPGRATDLVCSSAQPTLTAFKLSRQSPGDLFLWTVERNGHAICPNACIEVLGCPWLTFLARKITVHCRQIKTGNENTSSKVSFGKSGGANFIFIVSFSDKTVQVRRLDAVTADSGTPTAGTPSREDSRQRSPAVMKFSDDSSKVVGRQLSGSPRQLKVRIENSRQREVRVQFVTEHLKCSPRHPEAPVKLCIAQCALNKFLPKGRGFLNVSPDPPVDRITTFCQSNGSGEVSRARRVSNISRYLNRLLCAPLARRLILDKTRVTNIKKNI
ncbi:hypothetical protein Bbelb_111160 [Branchiostoma belcheri]|nr:hypothetical protein Bbelb_111160 [Branchiostoma belcheri]